ncbi:MAG: methyltransferase domain-containing protein [Acidobacteriia bacterium]|nr:methyltransferase domain-containing protein [Terriglobia bacterium]
MYVGLAVGLYVLVCLALSIRSVFVRNEVESEQAQLKSPFMMTMKKVEDVLHYGPSKRRLKQTLAFILKHACELQHPIADMGEDNPVKKYLEDRLGVKIDSINGDFDIDHVSAGRYRKYGTVLSFEVLEHLFNPLLHLEEIKELLQKDGVLLLSTPSRPHFCWGQYHFHEIARPQLYKLFKRAGFEVVDKRRITMRQPWTHYVFGIRPFLRFWFGWSNLYLLRVMENQKNESR